MRDKEFNFRKTSIILLYVFCGVIFLFSTVILINAINNMHINRMYNYNKEECKSQLYDVLDGQTTAGYHQEQNYQEMFAQASTLQTFSI